MTISPYYPKALALGGLSLLGMGCYFLFLRPALLPEDARYLGTSLPALQAAVPGLVPKNASQTPTRALGVCGPANAASRAF